ncbi:MAG: Uma2 family endonuclease [Myxococcales bacterium]|nr:Uma2 family endonuclease [Myxococcales bacterium]
MTEAEYLAMERASSEKHELWRGEVFAMTGGTLAHAMLAMNVGAALLGALGSRGCRVLGSDAKVHVPATRGFVYPDVSVVCGELQTYDGSRDVLLNPMVVVEVLSESTERFDRGDEFAGYRSIASLADYVLISQRLRRVEVYTRQADGAWLLRAYDDEQPAVRLPSVDVGLALDEIYRGVPEAASDSA